MYNIVPLINKGIEYARTSYERNNYALVCVIFWLCGFRDEISVVQLNNAYKCYSLFLKGRLKKRLPILRNRFTHLQEIIRS